MQIHLVRTGILGHIGQFAAADALVYARGTSVICRTKRGLEFGSVMNRSSQASPHAHGTILRKASSEDHLLWARIEKNRNNAIVDCQKLLDQKQSTAALMDVELLFDGQTIFFYFLGEITKSVEAMTLELAEAYEARVQLRQFADAVTAGCGPDCGSDEASGCGDGGCSTCSIASACSTKSSVDSV